jgi:hypothetical protein
VQRAFLQIQGEPDFGLIANFVIEAIQVDITGPRCPLEKKVPEAQSQGRFSEMRLTEKSKVDSKL